MHFAEPNTFRDDPRGAINQAIRAIRFAGNFGNTAKIATWAYECKSRSDWRSSSANLAKLQGAPSSCFYLTSVINNVQVPTSLGWLTRRRRNWGNAIKSWKPKPNRTR